MYYRFTEPALAPASPFAPAGGGAAGLLLDDERPPLCDTAAYQATLPPEKAAELRLRRRVAIRFWAEQAPPEGEVKHTELSFLTRPWRGFPTGALVLVRTGDGGTEHLVLADSVFDTALNDVVDPGGLDPAGAALPDGFVGLALTSEVEEEVVLTVVGSALTLLEFTLFAAGPKGLVAAGAVSILHTLFDKYYPRTPKGPTQIEQLTQSIEAQFQAKDIRDATTGVLTYLKWFKGAYDARWADDVPTDPKYLEEFVADLHGAFSPESSVLKTLTLMSNPTYRHVGLNTYLLAASALALLRKTAVLLDTVDKPLKTSSYLPPMVKELDEHAKHAREAYQEIEKAIAARMAQITAPEFFEAWSDSYAGAQRYSGWRFFDRGAPGVQEFRYRLRDTCCDRSTGEPECRQAHAAHVAAVRRSEVAKYNFYDPGQMLRAIGELEKAHTTYDDILSGRVPA